METRIQAAKLQGSGGMPNMAHQSAGSNPGTTLFALLLLLGLGVLVFVDATVVQRRS
jgi:hypothetical protein